MKKMFYVCILISLFVVPTIIHAAPPSTPGTKVIDVRGCYGIDSYTGGWFIGFPYPWSAISIISQSGTAFQGIMYFWEVNVSNYTDPNNSANNYSTISAGTAYQMAIYGYVEGNHIDIYGTGSYTLSGTSVNEARHYFGIIEGSSIYGSYTHSNHYTSASGATMAGTALGSFMANKTGAQCPPTTPASFTYKLSDILQIRTAY